MQHHFGQVEASNFVLRRHWPLLVGQLLVKPPALAGGFAAGGAGTLARFGETTNELRFAQSASTMNRTPLMDADGAAARAQPRPAAAPPTPPQRTAPQKAGFRDSHCRCWTVAPWSLVLVLHRTQLFLERPRQRLDFSLVVARPPAFGCLSRPTIGSKSAGERCARCSCSDAYFW